MTWLQTNETQLMRDRMATLERKDDSVFLSVTRTGTLSITTAGVTVTWQSEIDSGGDVTWSGSSITVPIAGYYLTSFIGSFEAADSITADLIVNSVEVATMNKSASKDVKFSHTLARFYKAGDVLQLRLTAASSTHTLQLVTEDSAGESPIFHVVLL